MDKLQHPDVLNVILGDLYQLGSSTIQTFTKGDRDVFDFKGQVRKPGGVDHDRRAWLGSV